MRRMLYLCMALVCGHVGACAAAEILILQSRAGEVQDAFVETLAGQLQADGKHRFHIQSLTDLPQAGVPPAGADVVVAVGAAACRLAAKNAGTPVLAALISRQEASDLKERAGNRQIGFIVLDQPLRRTLRLTRLIAPKATRVSALFGAATGPEESAFQKIATQIGLATATARISDESQIGPSLDRLLETSDVLVALPDGQVFNRDTAMSILLTSYRYRRPVIGFSEAYVRAGAIAAVFSTPADIAHQAAEWLNELTDYTQLAGQIRAPRHFRITVNGRVAEALGLDQQDPEMLAQALRAEEARR
ncbi:MAG: ABC transporter substrate binding protein [Rhodocyclaceae bacterium]